MTSATARTVANVVLASAGVAAAYVVMTRPPLRRLAIRADAAVARRQRAGVSPRRDTAGLGELRAIRLTCPAVAPHR